jgi:hypothetical protein
MIVGLLGPKRHTAEFVVKSRNLSPARRVSLLQALLHDEFPEDAEAIDATISEIKRLRDERNRITHWLWGRSDEPDVASLSKLPAFGEARTENRSAASVQAVADDLLKTVAALSLWSERVYQRTLASLRTTGTSLLAAFGTPADEDGQP